MIPAILIALSCVLSGPSTFPVNEVCQGPGCPNGGAPLRGFMIEAPAQPACTASITDETGTCTRNDSLCLFLGGVCLDVGCTRVGWLYNVCESFNADGTCAVELQPGRLVQLNWN